MAVDDADKRRSVPAVFPGLPGIRGPEPDGTIDGGDRLHIAGYYRGITPDVPPDLARKRHGFLLGAYP